MAASVVCIATLGLYGTESASALRLPPGNGAIACDVNGGVTVARSIRVGTARVKISGAVSNCTYNGTPIPFAGGTSRTVVVGNPTQICNALNQGGTIGKSVTKVVAFGHVVGTLNLSVTLSPAAPSGPGSAIELDGSFVANKITVQGHASVQTDRPVADLCNGAKSLTYTGSVQASWTRT